MRTWAHDALETDGGAVESDDQPEREVARAVLDFLRANPLGDGPAFRAWVDATDPFGESTHGVELLTFHGAKGREWHTVLLVGCETSLVPHRSATTNAARAEEARLLYVAVTRATDELIVNWAQRRGGYQRRLTPLLDGFVSHPCRSEPAARRTRRGGTARARAGARQAGRVARPTPPERRASCPRRCAPTPMLSTIVDHPPADAAELDAISGLGRAHVATAVSRGSPPRSHGGPVSS